MKYLALAVAAVTVGAFPALADEHTDAVMMMAEATICKISVSEGAKRISGGRTPSQVNYEIHGGIEALKKVSSSYRAAMCLAIGDRLKALP
jgi:acid phosphatase class B